MSSPTENHTMLFSSQYSTMDTPTPSTPAHPTDDGSDDIIIPSSSPYSVLHMPLDSESTPVQRTRQSVFPSTPIRPTRPMLFPSTPVRPTRQSVVPVGTPHAVFETPIRSTPIRRSIVVTPSLRLSDKECRQAEKTYKRMDECSEVRLSDDDTEELTRFEVNNHVCVYPRLPAEGEQELPHAYAENTLFWLARIDGIRVGASDYDGQPLVYVRLQWLYTRYDIASWLPEDWLSGWSKTMMEHMGRNEVVYSDHYDILDANVLEEKVNIVKVGRHPAAGWLAPGKVWYWRGTKLSIKRDFVDVSVDAFNVCIPQICQLDCRWHPDRHVIRWCDQCEVWMHVECIRKWKYDMDSLSNHQPYTDDVLREDENIKTDVKQLFLCPIERSDWYKQPLWSLDNVMMYARARVAERKESFYHSNWFDEFIDSVANDAPLAGGLTPERVVEVLPPILRTFMRHYALADKYVCTKCGCWV